MQRTEQIMSILSLAVTKEDLQIIDMALKFTIAYLDSESIHLLNQMTSILAKVEDKLNSIG